MEPILVPAMTRLDIRCYNVAAAAVVVGLANTSVLAARVAFLSMHSPAFAPIICHTSSHIASPFHASQPDSCAFARFHPKFGIALA